MITVTMFGLAAVADDAWLRVVQRTSQQCIARLRKRKTINEKRVALQWHFVLMQQNE